MIVFRTRSILQKSSLLPLRQHVIQPSHSLSSTASPIVELRQYQLYPSHSCTYTQHTIQSAPLRKSILPLKFFGFPETGAVPLNTAIHLYHYTGGHEQRLEQRAHLASRIEWKEYLAQVKECMISQSSEIFMEAPLIHQFDEVAGLSSIQHDNTFNNNTKSIIELRKYQLQLGYDTVPKFLSHYNKALPSKLNAADTHPTTQLVTILISDITSLNTVYEIWKHGDEQVCGLEAMNTSRVASRSAIEWRNGIGEIAKLSVSFESSVLRPTVFSPLK